MSIETENLAESLTEEIDRCEELIAAYATIGAAGQLGGAMIRKAVLIAHTAIMNQDTVGMLQAFQALKNCQ